jgi:hypothetical protein
MAGLRDKSPKSDLEDIIWTTLRRAKRPLTVHELAERTRTDYRLLQVYLTAEFLRRKEIRRVRVEDQGRKLWAYFHDHAEKPMNSESASTLREYADRLRKMADEINHKVRQSESVKRPKTDA